jgi:hypothetical protein
MKIYKIANFDYMYHNTSPENVFLIELHGLKINQEQNKTLGAREEILEVYGLNPIFLSLIPDKFRGMGDATLKIDVRGLDLVADIPSLYDLGSYYGDNEEGMWFVNDKIPPELKNYVDKKGMIYYDDLLNPQSPIVDVCIRLTKTAACENSIEPKRITVLA